MLNILVTNDDGYDSEGLRALCRVLEREPGLRVFAVVPERERSGSGHAITIHRPLMVQEIVIGDGGVRAWSVSGTPVDCAKLGIEALLPCKPDVLISGINRGANLGTDVFYSGTVSAAIEGTILEVPSVAISMTSWRNPEYSRASAFGKDIVTMVAERGLPPGVLLNVNVPPSGESKDPEVAITILGVVKYGNVFQKRVDPRGRTYYWMGGEVVPGENKEGTDVWAISKGMISVTPVHLDLTAYSMLEEMRRWFQGRAGL